MQAWGDKLELYAVVALLSLLGAAGCKPEIGDECDVSTDCSNVGDRLCDTTQPGGYCTIFNCEPGTCPEEAICVAFKTSACAGSDDAIRFTRTFCLKSCEENGDCRGGYDCIDMNNPDNPWGAQVVESGPVNGNVCIVPHQGSVSGVDAGESLPGVCTGTDAGFDVQFWEPDAGSPPADAATDASDAAADTGSDAPGDAADGGVDASNDASSD